MPSVVVRSTGASGRLLVHISLFLLITPVFFYRGVVAGPVTGARLIPLAALLLAASVTLPIAWGRGSIVLPSAAGTAFALTVIANVLTSAILQTAQAPLVLLFGAEMLLNLLIYYTAVVYVASTEDSLGGVSKALLLGTAPMTVAIMILASALAIIRRIGGSEQIGTAVNHLAHSLVIAVVAAYYLMVRRRSTPRLRLLAGLMFVVAALGVALTGSRAAMLAMILFLSAVAGMTLRSRRTPLLPIAGGTAIALVLVAIFLGDKMGPLVSRFSVDVIASAARLRLDVMLNAFNDVPVRHLLLGSPWRYQPLPGVADPIVYPHNLGLSMLLHAGMLPFVLLTYFVASRLWRLLRAAGSQRFWLEPFILLNILLITVLYASTSGRLTRLMTIFFALGLADGWLSLHTRTGAATWPLRKAPSAAGDGI